MDDKQRNCFSPDFLADLITNVSAVIGETCSLPPFETPVPFIVALVCVAITVLFLTAGILLGWSYFNFTTTLKGLTLQIRSVRGDVDQPMTESELTRMGKILGGDPLTRHGWNEFSETLLKVKSGILNTRQSIDFFPEQEMVESKLYMGFYEATASLLTGLGLFATFVALYIGLGELQVESGAVRGIEPFIEALSGKFLSSVLGLLAAVLFTLEKSLLIPRVYGTYREFCSAFDSTFDRLTAESILQEIRQTSEKQFATLDTLAVDFAREFRNNMQQNLVPPLERMVTALEASLGDQKGTFGEMANQLVETFRSSFSESANLDMANVTALLERTASVIEKMEERSSESSRDFASLSDKLENMTDRLSERLESASEQMGATHKGARAAFEKAIADALKNSSQQSQEMSVQVRQVVEAMREQMTEIVGQCAGIADGLREGGVEANAQLTESTRQLVERLTGVTERAASSIGEEANSLLRRGSDQNLELQSKIDSLLDREEARSHQISQQSEHHRDMVREFGTVLRESGNSVENLIDAASKSEAAGVALAEATSHLRRIQDSAGELVRSSAGQVGQMGDLLKSSRQLIGEYERVFEKVDKSLSAAIEGIANQVVEFQERAVQQLRNQLHIYDEHLAKASGQFGGSVQELAETMENASELIASKLDKLAE